MGHYMGKCNRFAINYANISTTSQGIRASNYAYVINYGTIIANISGTYDGSSALGGMAANVYSNITNCGTIISTVPGMYTYDSGNCIVKNYGNITTSGSNAHGMYVKTTSNATNNGSIRTTGLCRFC